MDRIILGKYCSKISESRVYWNCRICTLIAAAAVHRYIQIYIAVRVLKCLLKKKFPHFVIALYNNILYNILKRVETCNVILNKQTTLLYYIDTLYNYNT